MPPMNWPSNLIYTNKFININNITLPTHHFLEGVIIKEITDINHILYKQYGLFSRRRWKPFEIIGNYTGIVSEPSHEGRYVARLYHDVSPLETPSIDAQNYGNETRFINDYRNISDGANTCLVSTNISGEQHILIIVIKEIEPYTEILLDYGNDYWDFYNKKSE